jgi:XTP/dITP diphosphohydrolase
VKRLIVATTNQNKVREFKSALTALQGWEISVQPQNVPTVEETGATFAENAILKAKHTSLFVDDLVIADDSGLCIEALDGRPGVFSNRYATDDTARIQRVLMEMQSVQDEKRKAAFVCALALAQRGIVVWNLDGRVDGMITRSPKGSNGFGYDPIFFVPEFGRTMAELTLDEKNRVSHRGRALQQLVRHFLVSHRL